MASLVYISVPLKRTWEVDLIKPLKTFIANTYSSCNPEDYTQALTDFNKLRNNVISKSVDKHESALEVLYRYYDQLCANESKFPIAENQIRISFKWQDAFDKESFFSGKRTLAVASSSFERVCILFNIAALQSQVAEVQNHASDDGLKLSAKLYQQSSGVFNHLKDIVLSSVHGDPTPDIHPDTLNALGALMLAQAQDCFVRKSMNDKMKPAMIAKLSLQCSDLYADAMKLLQLESIKNLWPKDWLSSVAGKQASYHAIAEYYQSLQSKEAKEFGEEIARLRHAKELMASAEIRGGLSFIYGDVQKKILRGLQDAEKDNDFIYHSKIPELNSLAPISKAAVARSTPLAVPMTPQFKDLFEKVVPLAIHQALMAFENRKSEIINREVGRLREATQLLNSVLASLNLPASIEDLSGGGGVPVSVLEKAGTVREMGGISLLTHLMNELPALLQRNKEILDESMKLLSEEEQSDKQLRAQFNERWSRTPSEKLTESIVGEGSRFRLILDNAVNADGIVRQRFSDHREGIELLSRDNAAIENSLPSASPTAALQGLPCVSELKQLMQQVELIKSERERIENDFKEAACDMAPKFLSAMSLGDGIDEEQLSNEQLDITYSPLRERVSESIHQQENVLERVQTANSEFAQASGQRDSTATREQRLKDLAAAYDSFTELKSNLEEGTKFYNDLTLLLVKFQTKVSDFCFARKTEKDELMKDLSAVIARQPGGAHPAAPSYQQAPAVAAAAATGTDGNQNERIPPPRPPPPRSDRPPVPAPRTSAAPPPSNPAYSAPPVAAPHQTGPNPGGYPGAPYGQAAPYPTSYSGMPFPTYQSPVPASYNPFMNFGPSQPPVPGYSAYPGYPSQPPTYPGYQGGYPQQQYPPQQHYPPQGGYPTNPFNPGYGPR